MPPADRRRADADDLGDTFEMHGSGEQRRVDSGGHGFAVNGVVVGQIVLDVVDVRVCAVVLVHAKAPESQQIIVPSSQCVNEKV